MRRNNAEFLISTGPPALIARIIYTIHDISHDMISARRRNAAPGIALSYGGDYAFAQGINFVDYSFTLLMLA